MRRKPNFETVESEIRTEKAEALGRAGERLEDSIQKLQTLRQELLDLVAEARQSFCGGQERVPVEAEQRLREYMRLREQAKALRHSLIIQREAVGLLRHEDVDRQYPLPGPLLPLNAARHPGDE